MIHDVVANESYVWMDLAQSGHCPAGDWGALLGLGSDPSGVSFRIGLGWRTGGQHGRCRLEIKALWPALSNDGSEHVPAGGVPSTGKNAVNTLSAFTARRALLRAAARR